MSMDLPPIQQREFVLEPKSSNSEDFSVRIRNLIPASINSFLHSDNKKLSVDLDTAAQRTLAGLMGVNSLLGALDYMKPQDYYDGNSLFSSPIVMGLNVSILAALYAMQGLSSSYYEASLQRTPEFPTIEKGQLPTNNAKLREEVYNIALNNGIIPNRFKDPISRDAVETPVAFTDDPTATIYDLESVNALRKSGITQNPLAGNLRLDFNKLVYLPEVKKQIDEVNTKIDEINAHLNED